MGGCTRGYGNGFLKLSAGGLVTKLKVLEFFSALEFLELARNLKALDLRVAWSYKRVAPSDLVYERGHGKQEVRARAAAQQMQGLWRYTYTLCFNSAAS